MELIRQRHNKLILQPRAAIAADMNDELGDPFEDPLAIDRLEYVELSDLSRL